MSTIEGPRCDCCCVDASQWQAPIVRALREPVGLPLDRDVVVHDLFVDQGRQMVRLAVLLVGDRGLAEEAVQEAFVAVYRNWDGVRDKASLAGYVRAAVVNQCRSAQRGLVRARRLRDRMGAFRDEMASVESDAATDEALRIAELVRGLPQRQREVVVCRYYLDLTEAQTAALLELEIGTVKRHAHRAIQRLHRNLEVDR